MKNYLRPFLFLLSVLTAFPADVAPRNLSITTQLPAANDYLLVDGATNNTSKNLASNWTFKTNSRATLANLPVTAVPTGMTVQVLSGTTLGDNGGGVYYYNSTSALVPDGITIIQPVVGAGRWLIVRNAFIATPTVSTLGGVFAAPAQSQKFINAITTTGQPTFAQPVASDISGLGTIATQNSNAVNITGGSFDGGTVGLVARSVVNASNLSSSGQYTNLVATGTAPLVVTSTTLVPNLYVARAATADTAGSIPNLTGPVTSTGTATAITPLAVTNAMLAGGIDVTTKLTGVLNAAQSPATTGDVFKPAGSLNTTVQRINGVALGNLTTGILKNTTVTGVPSIAVAADFPLLNQNTTGNAATATVLQTARTINGVPFDGSANIVVSGGGGGSVDANALTGNTLAAGVVNSSLTSVGVLSSLQAGVITRAGSSTVPSVWGVMSNDNSYNILSMNNAAASTTMLGMAGGGGVDKNLYFQIPSTGTYIFRVNGVQVGGFDANGLQSTPIGLSDPRAAQFTTVSINSNINLRTTKANLHLMVNVKDHGATGNGSTDDTAAILAAKNEAVAAHGTLYFPAGVYITDQITVVGAAGLTICGDGMGVSTIKKRQTNVGGGALNVTGSNHINVYGLSFDGRCTTRTPGGQAVVFDTVDVLTFSHNEIYNSGEFALYVGDSQASNVLIDGNLIGLNWADGININHTTNFIISNNRVTGSDDDCIALGSAVQGIVIGNHVKHRDDSVTGFGRGIWCGFATQDVLIANNIVYGSKASGINVIQEGGVKMLRIKVIGNIVMNSPRLSGQPISIKGVKDCTIENNTVYDPPTGTSGLIEFSDWDNLKVSGNKMYQRTNGRFARALHVEEGSGYATTTWNDLTVSHNEVYTTGDGTLEGIFFQPNPANTMTNVIIQGNIIKQFSGGNIIQVSGLTTGMCKIINNVTMTSANGISPGNGGIFTVLNNY